MIQLSNVTKSFRNDHALRDVSLNVNKKERVVILGHSGSGKTTLLRVIAGLETPDKGDVFINGRLASRSKIIIPPHERKVGMVFQGLALWPHMNVLNNICFGLERMIKDKAQRHREAEDMLKLVHLKEKMFSFPAQLSGGQQQRVALARALIRRPDILLMDEPLSHADPQLKRSLVKLIRDLHQRFEPAIVYVTHDTSIEQDLAERTIIMNQGHSRESASYAQ